MKTWDDLSIKEKALRKIRGLEADDAWAKSPEGQRKLKILSQ